MKSLFCKLAAVIAITFGMVATSQAAFVGAYDLANWTQSNAGGTGGTFFNVSGAPDTLFIQGGNSGCGGNCDVLFSIQAPATGLISFNWDHQNFDVDNCCEVFGFSVNGSFTELADSGPASGFQTVSINANDTFAFEYNCTDCVLGSGNATITNFSAVPEPTTIALLGLGLFGFAATRRRK